MNCQLIIPIFSSKNERVKKETLKCTSVNLLKGEVIIFLPNDAIIDHFQDTASRLEQLYNSMIFTFCINNLFKNLYIVVP